MPKISPESTLNIPVLTFPKSDMPVDAGMDGILFDGEPFPFATVGEWHIDIGQDRVTTINVDIAVKLGEVPE